MRFLVSLLLIALPAWPQDPPLTPREKALIERLERVERRLAELEARLAPAPASAPIPAPTPTPAPQPAQFGATFDGYYAYNFNRPAGAVNLLRAYDQSHSSFSLNQASFLFDLQPDAAAGRRWGLRADIMFGQAPDFLQGTTASESRPNIYRPVYQAYGTYLLRAGARKISLDFGKWASSLGYEGNYTKDQFNYSRSYFYNFSPFYHFGFRTAWDAAPCLTLTHYLVNGTQQSEDFNTLKSQALLVTLRPSSTSSLNLNYYRGVEGRDTPGRLRRPDGRMHLVDAYATWDATPKLTLAGLAYYVLNRDFAVSAPLRVSGGSAYLRYRLLPRFSLAARTEYLSDRGGWFSGVTQTLKETTLTASFHVAPGFLFRTEYRRDASNRAFFLTHRPGLLKREQSTATLGLIWYYGKPGAW